MVLCRRLELLQEAQPLERACNVSGLARSRPLDWFRMDRTRAAVRTASAGPCPERRVWIGSSQPRSFMDWLTACKALIRGRQVFQLHQSRWGRGVRIRHAGRPTRELALQVSPTPIVCCPF